MNQLKVLVLANNRQLFCSKGLVQAGTNVNKLVVATTLKSQFWNKPIRFLDVIKISKIYTIEKFKGDI